MPYAHDLLDLKTLLARRSLSFEDVTLSSGEASKVYVDGKLTTLRAEAMPLVGRAFLAKMLEAGWLPRAVGGLTVGADPISVAIARESLDLGTPIDAFIVRKDRKPHGKQRWVEGIENPDGCDVVIIDDVCTKGGSTSQAIHTARQQGMNVLGAICLVDRQQGAVELLQEKDNVQLLHIFTLAELEAHKRAMEPAQVMAAS